MLRRTLDCLDIHTRAGHNIIIKRRSTVCLRAIIRSRQLLAI